MTVSKISIVLVTGVLSGWSMAAGAENLTRTVAGGGVTAKITYLNPKSTDGPRFQIVLDTHSVNLDAYDLKTIAVLRDEGGRSYTPAAVENTGGGHHREAIVSFSKLPPETKRIELLIRDVAGVKERIFQWELQ
jgi:hypothetical protein